MIAAYFDHNILASWLFLGSIFVDGLDAVIHAQYRSPTQHSTYTCPILSRIRVGTYEAKTAPGGQKKLDSSRDKQTMSQPRTIIAIDQGDQFTRHSFRRGWHHLAQQSAEFPQFSSRWMGRA